MGTIFSPNIAECPHCHKTFEHNRVNGLALIQAGSEIESRKRMRCRLSLDDLEDLYKRGDLDFPVIKKIFLDAMNDFSRDVGTVLGIGTDRE